MLPGRAAVGLYMNEAHVTGMAHRATSRRMRMERMPSTHAMACTARMCG